MGLQSQRADCWKAVRPLLLAPLVIAGCAATQTKQTGDGFHSLAPSASATPSWTDKLTAPFKAGASAVNNRQATANDEDSLSLAKKPNKNNPDLIVAVAQMHERAGKLDDAEAQYKKALKANPKHLNALVGYAHLQDRRSKFEEATKLYQKAIAAHPTEAAVYNDLGLCFHRRGMMNESHSSLVKAVELAPERKLYRNNLATVNVEQGNLDAALAQLTAAHGQAAGHYNLGYLLAKKGDRAGALVHFQQAAVFDPTLAAAQQWAAKLTPRTPATGPTLAGSAYPSSAPPHVALRYPVAGAQAAPQPQLQMAPQPGWTQAVDPNRWSAPPSAVRYPNQQTSTNSGAAAVPPTPDQVR